MMKRITTVQIYQTISITTVCEFNAQNRKTRNKKIDMNCDCKQLFSSWKKYCARFQIYFVYFAPCTVVAL